MMNPLAKYARPQPGAANPVAKYARPQPGAASPDVRYRTPERKPKAPPRNPRGGFLGRYLETLGGGMESIGRNIGTAMNAAANAAPAARALGRVGDMVMLQGPAEKRGRFLRNVYADQDPAAGDVPILRAIGGKASPFRSLGGKSYTPEGYDYAMQKFKRTHAWARKTKNTTDAEMAVKYLLAKKHKGYYSP